MVKDWLNFLKQLGEEMNEERFFERFVKNFDKFSPEDARPILKQLVDERQQFFCALSSLDEALMLFTEKGLFYQNEQATRLFGINMKGKEKQPEEILRKVRNKALFQFVVELFHSDKDLNKIFADSDESRFFDVKKRRGKYVTLIIIQDISQQKRLEFQLKNLESVNALNNLAAGIAHEIKNPMSAIDMHTQVLKKGIDREMIVVPEEVAKYLEIVSEETARLNAVLNDFLMSARKHELKLTFEEVEPYLEEISEFMKPEMDSMGVTLIKDFGEHIPRIFIDKPYLRQAVLNLLKNAMEATEGCDRKLVKLESYYDSAKDSVAISIWDSGRGIPEDEVNQIFDPYFTKKDYGTGLGLTIVYKVIQEHGGEIAVDSGKRLKPPFVTCFTMLLPASRGMKYLQ